jgi:predicted GNAT family N-acyltransferase
MGAQARLARLYLGYGFADTGRVLDGENILAIDLTVSRHAVMDSS